MPKKTETTKAAVLIRMTTDLVAALTKLVRASIVFAAVLHT